MAYLYRTPVRRKPEMFSNPLLVANSAHIYSFVTASDELVLTAHRMANGRMDFGENGRCSWDNVGMRPVSQTLSDHTKASWSDSSVTSFTTTCIGMMYAGMRECNAMCVVYVAGNHVMVFITRLFPLWHHRRTDAMEGICAARTPALREFQHIVDEHETMVHLWQ